MEVLEDAERDSNALISCHRTDLAVMDGVLFVPAPTRSLTNSRSFCGVHKSLWHPSRRPCVLLLLTANCSSSVCSWDGGGGWRRGEGGRAGDALGENVLVLAPQGECWNQAASSRQASAECPLHTQLCPWAACLFI